MKFIRIMLTLVLLATILPIKSTYAVSNQSIISVTTAYLEKAGTVNMSVSIDSDEQIAAGSFDVEFDSTLTTVQANRVVLGETVSSLPLTSLGTEEVGKISVAWAQTKGVKMKGTLVDFPARIVAANAGEKIPFKLRNVQLYDAKGKEIPVKAINGQIKPFDGKETEHPETVGVDKVWTVRLSEPYHPGTLTDQAVTLKRGTIEEEITITPLTDRSFQVKANSPLRKTKYTLEITEQLSSANGSKLKEPVRHIFTVR